MNRPINHIQSFQAYRSGQFRAQVGANAGDPLGVLDDLVLDDSYQLTHAQAAQRLALAVHQDGAFSVGPDTEVGQPGADLHLDCRLSLMSPDGTISEALLFVEVDTGGMIAEIFLVPLAPLTSKTEYTLVRAERDGCREKLAQVASVSFTRGTHITLATGEQRQIEALHVGDRVLTRDDGPQVVRWIGRSTTRATGDLAPIRIKAGALNNENDLIVSPEHRLFVYQRSDEIGAGATELLVKARHLVNGTTVLVQDGGYVEYFQILFDRHHIIFAEGIAAESLPIDALTKPSIPPELLNKMTRNADLKDSPTLHGVNVREQLLNRPDSVEKLKRSSLR